MAELRGRELLCDAGSDGCARGGDLGNGDAPLVHQGAHRERRSKEPEACHQGLGGGGGGVRAAQRRTGTEDSTSGVAAGSSV